MVELRDGSGPIPRMSFTIVPMCSRNSIPWLYNSVTPPINDMNYNNYGGDSGRFSSGSLSFPSAPTRSMGSFDGITGRSRLLEDFRNNRLQNPQLRELVNHMFEFSQGTVQKNDWLACREQRGASSRYAFSRNSKWVGKETTTTGNTHTSLYFQ